MDGTGGEDTGFVDKGCAYCRGEGRIGVIICPACGGRGQVLVRSPPVRCACCSGLGVAGCCRCSTCEGSGWTEARRRDK